MYALIRHEPRYQALLSAREQHIELQRQAIADMDTEAGP